VVLDVAGSNPVTHPERRNPKALVGDSADQGLDRSGVDGRTVRPIPDPSRLIPLKTSRISRRMSHLEIRPGWLVLRLPWYFVQNTWQVPISEVDVVDLSARRTTVKPSAEVYAEVYADPITFPS
jgi:hypothetical protein